MRLLSITFLMSNERKLNVLTFFRKVKVAKSSTFCNANLSVFTVPSYATFGNNKAFLTQPNVTSMDKLFSLYKVFHIFLCLEVAFHGLPFTLIPNLGNWNLSIHAMLWFAFQLQ